MAENPPQMNPSLMIDEQAAALGAKLAAVAREAVQAALEQGALVTVADIINALEALTSTLPPALVAQLEIELPRIAEQAIIAASVEIADAREASGKPFPPVSPPASGDYSAWTATATAALVASLRKRAEPAVQAAATVADAGELSAQVLAELDDDIRAALSALFDTAAARAVNEGRMEVFRANADVVQKVKVVTVADAKRSEVCTNMNGATFDPKRPVPTPPFHNGCRSYLRAITTAKRKQGATEADIYRQNWAIYRRLEREAKAEGRADERLELRFAPTAGGAGEFAGYAVTWDRLDNHRTSFARGSLNLPAAGIPLLWAHDPARPVGAVIEAREDDAGLFIRGKLTLSTTDGSEAHALLRDRAVTGLSIGFRRLSDEPTTGGRRILAADLKEISLVSLPSNETARITEVRAHPAAGAAQHEEHRAMPLDNPAPAESGDIETRVKSLETKVDGIATKLDEIAGGVKAAEQRADRLEARGSRLPLGGGDQPANALETRAFGTFIRRGREAMGAEEIRSLRVSDDTAGGFLAPDQFQAELLRNLVQFSPVRSAARVATTSAGAVLLPKRTGGMTAQWVGETGSRPETNVTFGQNRYPVAELAAYIDVSNAMLEDSAFDVAAELAFEFAEEFGKAEGTAFVNGAGPLQPAGFMQDAGVNFTVSGHASQVTADGLIQIFHDLPSAYRANGVWMMNSTTLGIVRKLKDGTSGQYLLLTQGIGNAPATTLLGRPVVEAPDMPDVGAGNFPIAFGDFRQGYRVFDRVNLSILRDPYSQATNGMTRFHGRRRVAGGVAKAEALRKLKIST